MKICDRHFRVDGSSVLAQDTISFGPADSVYETYDLCASCAGALKDVLNNPAMVEKKSERGRPRKVVVGDKEKTS